MGSGQVPSGSETGRSDELTLEAGRIWAGLKPVLRASLGSDVVRSWIEPLTVLGASDSHVRLGAPNSVASSRVRVQYLPQIQKMWQGADPAERRLIVEQRPQQRAGQAPGQGVGHGNGEGAGRNAAGGTTAAGARSDAVGSSATGYQSGFGSESQGADVVEMKPRALGLIARTAVLRTFDGLAVGPDNRVAAAIARRVAENRPRGELVCLCGPHGIGKTHLMEAIVNRAREVHPDAEVRLVTAGAFTEAFTQALRAQTLPAFKAAVRTQGVLLIDDIHLILGKNATQSELFQTILSVTQAGGTVVVTAEAAPDGLPGLTARERSILSGGFLAQIREPDFEQRRAIARLKVDGYRQDNPGFDPPEEALDVIAARVHGTGRDVEGAVKLVFAATELVGQEADMEQIQRVLSEDAVVALPAARSLTVDQIKKRLAACYNMSVEDLTGQCRRRAIARPRQLAMYLARKIAGRSFPDIGARFGGRDHTTVMHAVRKVEELMLAEPAYAREVQDVTRKLMNPDGPRA